MRSLLLFKTAIALAFLMLLVLAASAFSAGMSTGDGSWEWMNPAPQGNNVNAVSFVSSSTGWAAGNGGMVMKTTDGGTTWTEQTTAAFASPAYSCSGSPIGTGCSLRGIFFIDASTGWAVGDYGNIWKTVNGGTTWVDQHGNMTPLPVSTLSLSSVHFYNTSVGIIVGDGITLYTTNGGTTWTKGSGTGTSLLTSVQMLSTTTAIAVGKDSNSTAGLIYKTTNGGQTWTAKTITGTARPLNSVSFSGASNGYAAGGSFIVTQLGSIIRTTDGGETWVANSNSIPTEFTGVAIQGGDKLVTTGYGGSIMRNTVNIWTNPIDTVASGLATVTSGTTNYLSSVVFAPGGTTGFIGGSAGVVLASSDSGGSWSTKAGGNAVSYYSSSFVDASNGWTVGDNGTVTHTSNGGSTWSSDNAGIDSNADLYGVNFRSTSLGFAVGSIPGSPEVGVAYKYNSGTWSAMSLPAGVSYLSEIRMSDDTHGWAVGKEGVILGTSDGSTWSKTVPDATYNLNSVDTTSSANGWVVGQAPCSLGTCSAGQTSLGVILRYNGTNWTTLPLVAVNNVSYFTAIDMVDANNGWAVGYHSSTSVTSGRIYKTIDGGATWTEQTSPTSRLIAGVSMQDTSTGYLVAAGGRIAKTTNGGTSWTIENAGVDLGLYSGIFSVAVISSGSSYGHFAYAAGGNGAILKLTATPSTTKAITGLTIPGQIGTTTINESAHTVALTMPYGTNVTALVPTITITGASVNPANGAAHNFTTPQTYTVTAEDASTQDYTVTVTVALNPAKAITGLTIPGQIGTTTINESAHTVALTMPYGTDFTALVPTITYTGALVNPASGAAHNFTTPQTYTVTAEDASIQAYTVTVALDETPFNVKWSALSGAPGAATSAATPITGGSGMFKDYANGRLYYNEAQGAVYWVHGGIMVMYDILQGHNGPYGLPISDEEDATGAPGGRQSRFSAGNLYWSITTGTHGLQGTFLTRFLDTGGPAANGLPISDGYPVWGGFGQNMQSAYVTIEPGQSVGKLVRGGIFAKYQMLGGPGGALHLITAEEHSIIVADAPGAVQADFQNGYVFWSSVTGSHPVNGGIYIKYLSVGGPTGALGLPMTDEYSIPLRGGGQRQRFQHGFITWGALYGTWVDYT